jgi:hypothetical protein
VISSLVAHHMTDEELIARLRFMESNAAARWFVNDLLRHRFAYFGFRCLPAAIGLQIGLPRS